MMEAPLSPAKRSHSSFDLFVEAAGKRFEDESLKGTYYSNSVSSQSENEPPDFQNDFNKRSKFNASYAGSTMFAAALQCFFKLSQDIHPFSCDSKSHRLFLISSQE